MHRSAVPRTRLVDDRRPVGLGDGHRVVGRPVVGDDHVEAGRDPGKQDPQCGTLVTAREHEVARGHRRHGHALHAREGARRCPRANAYVSLSTPRRYAGPGRPAGYSPRHVPTDGGAARRKRRSRRVVVATLALMAVAVALPDVLDWYVHVHSWPPLHAAWDPRLGPGTVPAVLIGLWGGWTLVPLSQRLSWRSLLLVSFAAGLAWMLALALVDGWDGIGVILQTGLRVPPHRPRRDRRPRARCRSTSAGSTSPPGRGTGRCTSPGTRRARCCSSSCWCDSGSAAAWRPGWWSPCSPRPPRPRCCRR